MGGTVTAIDRHLGDRSESIRCGAVALAFAVALLLPAFWNGHALVRFDSAVYAVDARTLRFFEGRPIGYPLFLHAALATGTSWVALLAQSFLTSLLALRTGMALCPGARRPLGVAAAALAAAIVLSPIAAHSSTLMPDVFTSWLLLAGTLALASSARGDLLLAGTAWYASLLVHSTHLPVALVMLVLAFAATARGPFARPELRRRLALLAGLVPLAVLTQAGVARATGYDGPLGGHPAFLVSRQHSMGVLVDTLDRRCGERDWALCAHRDTLVRHPNADASWFLWYRASPFAKIGRFSAREELGDIAWEGLRTSWPRIAAETLRGTWQQFFLVETPTELDRRPAHGYAHAVRRQLPDEARRVAAAAQAAAVQPVRASFAVPYERELHVALCLAAALVGWRCARRGRSRVALFVAAVLLFLAVHALVVSFGTSPLGRYQGRVIWLVPFGLVLGLTGRR